MHDVLLLKDLEANSVRTAHYPNDELFLDLCDELGILVWEENHARGLCLEQMQNPNFEPQAEQVTREMVLSHYNHPSVYIWGILNECASDSEFGKQCYEKQFAIIRALDKTRPCSFASCKFKTDISFGLPDVVSYNIYPKWYHDTPVDAYLNDLYTWVQTETEGKGKPFLVTEIGAGGIYGYRTQMERGVSAKGAFGTTHGSTLPPRLLRRVYLAVFRYPHQRRMVGREAAHDEQQGRRRRIPKAQALL